MAQNYISRGEVITLTARASHTSGTPYRISGFNGVALISVESGEQLSFQLDGIFEFEMTSVKVGDIICINAENKLSAFTVDPDGTLPPAYQHGWVFGRAVTGSDGNGKFYCRLLQS